MGRLLRLLTYFVLLLTFWFLWPREMDGFSPGRDGRLSVPDYSMTNAHYVSVKEGKVEMESFSKDSTYDLPSQVMDVKDVTAYFYNELNQKTEVKADKGKFTFGQHLVHLEDNVRALSPDGFLMTGPEANYRMDLRVLTAPRPVEGEMKERNLKVWGDSARAPLDERKVFLDGNARAQFPDKRRGLTKIRGDRALVDRDQEQLLFYENVKVDQDKVVATSRNAQIFYAAKEKNVRYMSLLDDVKIEEGTRHTRSQVAEFFGPTDTIVLSVFPSVYHGDDVVTGDRITLYRATGVVEVTATNAAGSPNRQEKGAPLPKPVLTPEDEELIP